ncbi:MAG: STM3941 family protein [Niabella sp.]
MAIGCVYGEYTFFCDEHCFIGYRTVTTKSKVIRNIFIKQTNDTSYNAPENIRDDSSLDHLHWSITNIQSVLIPQSIFLFLYVKDPNKVIENAKGNKRKMMQGNMNTYGTPLSISSNTLKYNFADLEKLLQERLNE